MHGDNDLEILIKLRDEASKKVKEVASNFRRSFGTIVNVDLPYFKEQLDKFGRNAARVGGILTATLSLPLLAIGKAAFDAASKFEQSTIAFTTMLGSADKARKLLNELALFAAKTPFQLPEVEQGAKMLLAMGASLEDIIFELKIMGDVSAGLNVPIERLILNFGQVRAQGKLTGRELRDFAIAGVPLLDELANSLGKSKEEITAMVSRGEIGFAAVKQAFIDMTSEGGRFNNLMQEQSTTTAGKISNLKDQFTLLLRELGEQLLPVANKVIEAISGIVGAFMGLTDEQKKTILIIGGIIAAIGPVIAFVGGLAILIGALLNPIGLTVLAIMGIGTAIVAVGLLIKSNIQKAIDKFNELKSTAGGLINKAIDWGKSIGNNIVNGIRNAFNNIGSAAKGLVNALIDLINKALGNSFWPLNRLRIPRFAKGVENFGGGSAIVGEHGPEIVNLPRGSDVIPNNRIGSMGSGVNQIFNLYQVSTALDVELAMERAAIMARRGFR